MNDLISRQAAIEAVHKEFDECLVWDESGETTANEVEKILEELPSAQPQRWIPCSERLPEDGTWNIFTDGKKISIGRYKFDVISHFWPEPRWFDLEDAIAWMPLPEPWKGEEE